MTQIPQLPPELAALAAQYAQPGGFPAQAPAPQQQQPQYAPPQPQQYAPGPLQAVQPMTYTPPQAPQPVIYQPPATNVYQVPQAHAQALVQQHLAQALPINPPEVVQALSPDAPPPQPVKRGRGAKAAKADAIAGVSLSAPDPTLAGGVENATTEQLVEALAERGYSVTLAK